MVLQATQWQRRPAQALDRESATAGPASDTQEKKKKNKKKEKEKAKAERGSLVGIREG
ncbi:hypothetical protein [Paracidovorax konjaci]|uniref:Uncharacterized protein n=1 Tax=Paracidovorax konjaci TaxID=32040 RepID=A0A1I1SEW2_9BURK|nr:hypothetical protein [Paracidovorax konjaci]SFD45029.1 hypothetical protein SAMN04489710_102171 [Paracidovorax konjaci]